MRDIKIVTEDLKVINNNNELVELKTLPYIMIKKDNIMHNNEYDKYYELYLQTMSNINNDNNKILYIKEGDIVNKYNIKIYNPAYKTDYETTFHVPLYTIQNNRPIQLMYTRIYI